MHVKSILIAAAASGAIFYAVGRSGHELKLPLGQLQGARAQEQQTADKPDLAQAQPAPSRPPAPRTPSPTIDESALRYFATQGDTRRFEAELARLRALYPEWRPPTDLNAAQPSGDPELERLWKLFAEGKLSEVRAAIAQRGTVDPNWRTPSDLTDQLDRAEAAQRLVNASNARQWEQVIRIGTETPALLTCSNVDALWRVADAFLQTQRAERARDAYSYVLANCRNTDERLGTMQKALAGLQEDQINPLLAQERQNEFATIRDELVRRRVGRAAEDPKLVAAADDLHRLEGLANATALPGDLTLLGFYAFRHGDPRKASEWFRIALSRDGGAKAAEGAVLALSASGKHQEAEVLGAQWLEAGPANRKAYLDSATSLVAIEPPPRLDRLVIERIAKMVNSDRYSLGASGLGWYAYNSGQIAAAESWFEMALAWDPAHEPAAYGLALSRQRLRNLTGMRAIVAEWGSRSQRIAEILDPRRQRVAATRDVRRDLTTDRGAGAAAPLRPLPAPMPRGDIGRRMPRNEFVAEPSAAAPAESRGVTDKSCRVGNSGAAALARGWCLLNLKRPSAAAAAFEAAMRTSTGQVAADAAAGKAYAAIQQGLTTEAETAAASAALPPARQRELTALLLAERFYALYDAKNYNGALVTLEERARYAPETTDLMQMRGWSYFNEGRYADARKVFRALYKLNGSSQALSGLTAIDDATRINRY